MTLSIVGISVASIDALNEVKVLPEPSRVKGMINILMIFDLKIKLYYIIESLYYAISSDSIFSVKLASLLIIYE